MSYIRLYLHEFEMSYNRFKISSLKRHIPLYQSVMQRVFHLLADGDFKPGQPLPSEWDLARQWNVSQGTVRKGLSELAARGILQRYQGVGTLPSKTGTGDIILLLKFRYCNRLKLSRFGR